MSIGIYVVSHKKYEFPQQEEYIPIKVGRMKNDFAKITDDIGDNISSRNSSFCELTALYWLWKNKDLEDFVGVCHYRRYFYINNPPNKLLKKCVKNINDCKNEIATVNIETLLNDYEIIVPKAEVFLESMENNYKRMHIQEHWDVMMEVISEKLTVEEMKIARKTFSNKYGYICNMFITRKNIFNDYMKWLFEILFELEKRININLNDSYQCRVFGFIAERLQNVYIHINKLNALEVPMIYISEKKDMERDKMEDFKYLIEKNSPIDLVWLMNLKNRGL